MIYNTVLKLKYTTVGLVSREFLNEMVLACTLPAANQGLQTAGARFQFREVASFMFVEAWGDIFDWSRTLNLRKAPTSTKLQKVDEKRNTPSAQSDLNDQFDGCKAHDCWEDHN